MAASGDKGIAAEAALRGGAAQALYSIAAQDLELFKEVARAHTVAAVHHVAVSPWGFITGALSDMEMCSVPMGGWGYAWGSADVEAESAGGAGAPPVPGSLPLADDGEAVASVADIATARAQLLRLIDAAVAERDAARHEVALRNAGTAAPEELAAAEAATAGCTQELHRVAQHADLTPELLSVLEAYRGKTQIRATRTADAYRGIIVRNARLVALLHRGDAELPEPSHVTCDFALVMTLARMDWQVILSESDDLVCAFFFPLWRLTKGYIACDDAYGGGVVADPRLGDAAGAPGATGPEPLPAVAPDGEDPWSPARRTLRRALAPRDVRKGKPGAVAYLSRLEDGTVRADEAALGLPAGSVERFGLRLGGDDTEVDRQLPALIDRISDAVRETARESALSAGAALAKIPRRRLLRRLGKLRKAAVRMAAHDEVRRAVQTIEGLKASFLVDYRSIDATVDACQGCLITAMGNLQTSITTPMRELKDHTTHPLWPLLRSGRMPDGAPFAKLRMELSPAWGGAKATAASVCAVLLDGATAEDVGTVGAAGGAGGDGGPPPPQPPLSRRVAAAEALRPYVNATVERIYTCRDAIATLERNRCFVENLRNISTKVWNENIVTPARALFAAVRALGEDAVPAGSVPPELQVPFMFAHVAPDIGEHAHAIYSSHGHFSGFGIAASVLRCSGQTVAATHVRWKNEVRRIICNSHGLPEEVRAAAMRSFAELRTAWDAHVGPLTAADDITPVRTDVPLSELHGEAARSGAVKRRVPAIAPMDVPPEGAPPTAFADAVRRWMEHAVSRWACFPKEGSQPTLRLLGLAAPAVRCTRYPSFGAMVHAVIYGLCCASRVGEVVVSQPDGFAPEVDPRGAALNKLSDSYSFDPDAMGD